MMIDPVRVVKLLVDRVTKNEDPDRRVLRQNVHEEEVANYLLEVIDNVCKCISYEFESTATLDYDDEKECDDSEDANFDPDFDETKEDKLPTNRNFTLDFMEKVVEFYDARDANGRRKYTWKSTKHRLRSVPHQQYITRFRYYIEQNGTKREKMQVIEDFVYDKFEEARNRVLSVHDHDLRRWALQRAAEDSVLNFQASENWLRAFKHRHRICSRKITKLMTRYQTEDSAAITASADSFLVDAKREMKHYTPDEILNTDQIGLELSLIRAKRLLSLELDRKTLPRIHTPSSP